MIKAIYFISFVTIISFAKAQTTLPAFFNDSMVLQQQSDAAIWGWDKANTKISITTNWGATAASKTDEHGKWKLKLKTPKAGGPFKITIKGSSTIVYKNVLIGEVWLCSGQSNMEMPVKGYRNQPILGSNEAILTSTNSNIRCFDVPRTVSKTPLDNISGSWKHASPSNTGGFSATAYFFAKKMNATLDVPIGIIHTSWGASSVEAWMDSLTLASTLKVNIPQNITNANANTTHTILYKSMLHPFIGYTIKGVLWYQGESNRPRAKEYQTLLPQMINSWRNQWQQDTFPFYFVQIAPHSGLPNNNINGAFLREAQLKTMLNVPKTGMAVTMDIGEQFLIHPAQKETVGNRLAYWALAKDYNISGIAYSGPVFDKIEKNQNDTMTISFKYADMGLTSFGKPLSDFEIAGEDQIFHTATAFFAKGKGEWISVTSDKVKNPVSIRYGFSNWVQGCLFNTQGLPASSFRTDNW